MKYTFICSLLKQKLIKNGGLLLLNKKFNIKYFENYDWLMDMLSGVKFKYSIICELFDQNVECENRYVD